MAHWRRNIADKNIGLACRWRRAEGGAGGTDEGVENEDPPSMSGEGKTLFPGSPADHLVPGGHQLSKKEKTSRTKKD